MCCVVALFAWFWYYHTVKPLTCCYCVVVFFIVKGLNAQWWVCMSEICWKVVFSVLLAAAVESQSVHHWQQKHTPTPPPPPFPTTVTLERYVPFHFSAVSDSHTMFPLSGFVHTNCSAACWTVCALMKENVHTQRFVHQHYLPGSRFVVVFDPLFFSQLHESL